jgi:hypothetical protein
MSLTLGKEGQVAAVRLDQRDVPLSARPVLLQVRDAAANGYFIPIQLAVEHQTGELQLKSQEHALELNISGSISAHGGFLKVDGQVADQTGRDRCIELKICLPIATNGFVRATGLAEDSKPSIGRNPRKKARKQQQQTPDAEIDVPVPDDNASYPLCPMSSVATGAGLSLAVPPTHPTRFLTGSDASGAYILFRIGLSQATAKPSRTPFCVIVYRHDAQWGFRSSLARYYDFYRADFFTRRVKKIGAWTTQNASLLKHPELYAYHEAGFTTWRHPGGTDSGINVGPTLERLEEGPACTSLEQYEQLCELALDRKHGIYALPYTIVGQRQILQLPALPQNYEEALKVLDTWSTTQPVLFDGPPQALSFRSADELKTIIRNSTIYDAVHGLQWVARPYRGPTLTFPQNPSPNLYRDTDKPTIAKYTLDYYLPMIFKSRFVDGCYLDSLGRWCGFYSYRTEHFKYASVPLTYAGDPPRPCLWNLSSHAEYLWELGKRLHAQGKIFFANGIHPNRVMLGFACDVMGEEGRPTYDAGESFYSLRVAAGLKPYCLLNAAHRVSPKLWNSCLYMGYLMGCNSEKGLADEAKYLPLIIRINEVGWQPVTHAHAGLPVIGIERWDGQEPKSPLFFTVMNRSADSVAAEVTVDLAALHRSGETRASSLLPEVPVVAERTGRQLVLRVKLAPEQATAIEIHRQTPYSLRSSFETPSNTLRSPIETSRGPHAGDTVVSGATQR